MACRAKDPFKDLWALPGGFVGIEESLEECANRKLTEKTGAQNVYLEQLYSFGAINRDPRERVISVAYFSLVPFEKLTFEKQAATEKTQWYAIHQLPTLAFDHRQIIRAAHHRLVAKLEYSTVGLSLLPDAFTLSHVQDMYEIVSGKARDKRNFRKWLLGLNVIEETGGMQSDGAHRPAKLYRRKNPNETSLFR